MTNCNNCGIQASPEIEEIISEGNYDGDYFCSDECRDFVRQRQSETYDKYEGEYEKYDNL